MQIGGINSAEYRNKNNGQNRVNRNNSTENKLNSTAKVSGESPSVPDAKSGLLPAANRDVSAVAGAKQKIAFYNTQDAKTNTPIPDNTSHKARQAIAEYLSTQYVEERNRFKEALGVDEYA